MNADLFARGNAAVTELITQYGYVFQAMGVAEFHSIAAIVLAWYGIKVAFSGVEGGGLPFGQFIELVVRMSVVYTMVTYYYIPIPGLGISFVHLITDQSLFLVNELNVMKIQDLMSVLANFEVTTPFPSLYEVGALFRAVVIILGIIGAEAAIFTIISYGYAALGVVVLLGPIFIPFAIVPEMEWLFQGWLRCFLQYSFYPVVGAAYLFVAGNVLVAFLKTIPGALTPEIMATQFGPMMIVLIVFIFGAIKIPSLVHGLFTGHAGESAFPRFWRR